MAVEKFHVEAGHIMMFARAIGDPNPIFDSDRHRSDRDGRAADVRAGERPVRSRLLPAPEGRRRRVVRLRQGADRAPSAPPAAAAVAAAAVAVAAVSTPSSTSRSTARSAPATCSPATTRPGQDVGEGGQARRQAAVLRERHRVPRPERRAGRHRSRHRRAHREGGGAVMSDRSRTHRRDGPRRGPQAHDDRAVRRRVRRLQPAPHRRGVHDEGRRLPVGVRPRHAHDGHDRPARHRSRRRRERDAFGGRFTSQVFPGDTLTGKLVVDSVEDGVATMTVTTTNQDGVVVFSGQATGKV